MDEHFELRTPPLTRPLPSQAEIDKILDGLLLHSEDMFKRRPVPVQQPGRHVPGIDDDPDDMHNFVAHEDAANARIAADEQAYAQAAAAAAAQDAAAGAAQDAIDQARQDAFNRLNRDQKVYIEIKNKFTGGKMSELNFKYYNSIIKLTPRERAEVQPFIYKTAKSLAAARGAAASGGKRKSKKYHYKKKSKKSKANKRRRSRSNKRSQSNKRSRK
jgi:hypothetical protein